MRWLSSSSVAPLLAAVIARACALRLGLAKAVSCSCSLRWLLAPCGAPCSACRHGVFGSSGFCVLPISLWAAARAARALTGSPRVRLGSPRRPGWPACGRVARVWACASLSCSADACAPRCVRGWSRPGRSRRVSPQPACERVWRVSRASVVWAGACACRCVRGRSGPGQSRRVSPRRPRQGLAGGMPCYGGASPGGATPTCT